MDQINSYEELHQLPEGSVVQDADGEVWRVTRPRSLPGETWLEPFSDEYSFTVRPGGTYSLGATPPLPIQDTGIRDKTR